MTHLRRFTLMLLSLVILPACDSQPNPAQPGPTAPPTTADAEKVAETFLTGWTQNDYEKTMYPQLSARAKAIDPKTFASVYTDLDSVIKPSAKSFVIHNDQTERQGTTVAVHYDFTFESQQLGQFTDANRTMHLIL